jgi:cytochrome P450
MFLDPAFPVDPPGHGRYRAPLQQAFSPKAMLALKEDIRALANQWSGMRD